MHHVLCQKNIFEGIWAGRTLSRNPNLKATLGTKQSVDQNKRDNSLGTNHAINIYFFVGNMRHSKEGRNLLQDEHWNEFMFQKVLR